MSDVLPFPNIDLGEPARFSVSVAGGEAVEIDPYEAHEIILAAQQDRSGRGLDRLQPLRDYLSERLHVPPDQLASNQLLAFEDAIVGQVAALEEHRKKKRSLIADLLPSTQASRPISENGTGEKKKHGLPTGRTSTHGKSESEQPITTEASTESTNPNSP